MSRTPFNPSRRHALATGVALCSSAVLVACGGGGGDAGTPAMAAGPMTASAYTQGAITGFGSIIVGRVRFDDLRALFVDEDGNPRSRADLRLGMTVEVDSDAVDRATAFAVALRFRLGSEIVGPVGTIDSAASTVQVLGQTVLVTSSTVFDETLAGGLSALTAGRVVEVHGIVDPANRRIVATRIEPKDAAAAYKLRGVVANLDTAAKTFTINGQRISYASLAADVPAGLANGQIVRMLLQTTQVGGAWVATLLRGGLRLPEARRDAHVEGIITAFTSSASFTLNGLPVDASGATFPDGNADIVLGARVEVSGQVVNGVLVASKVEIEERRPLLSWLPLELRGEVGNLNTTAKTFALRGVTVWYGGTVEYRDGTEAALANGRKVEVRGLLSSDRTRIEARRIEFK